MHLINTETLQLQTVVSEEDANYAILSHRWEHDEVLYEDMKNLSICNKIGATKLKAFCRLACELGHKYAWMDTCCIDKSSSADLAEAINSMYGYYARAEICIAYLADVHDERGATTFEDSFRASVWFTRCWTLQELLAPRNVVFYNASWQKLDTKSGLVPLISDITQINVTALTFEPLSNFSIAQRMSWASHREATRAEDVAYSLMGIFDINMPMLYGERHKAFIRLQEEILRYSDDETIFAWAEPHIESGFKSGLLASSPKCFQHCRHMRPTKLHDREQTFVMTNRGIAGNLSMASQAQSGEPDLYIAFLNASMNVPGSPEQFIGIFLRSSSSDTDDFERVAFHVWPARHYWMGTHPDVSSKKPSPFQVRVRHKGRSIESRPQPAYGFDLGSLIHNPSPSWMQTFDGVIQVNMSKILLASGTQWYRPDGRPAMVVRLPPVLEGPVCIIEIEEIPKRTFFVQLRLSSTNEPICIILDNETSRPREDYWNMWYEGMLSRFESLYEDETPWTENRQEWQDQGSYVLYKMLPDQVNTHVYAFKAPINETARWILLQPDPKTGSFKNRARWIIHFTPNQNLLQKVWKIEIKRSSKMVLY